MEPNSLYLQNDQNGTEAQAATALFKIWDICFILDMTEFFTTKPQEFIYSKSRQKIQISERLLDIRTLHSGDRNQIPSLTISYNHTVL